MSFEWLKKKPPRLLQICLLSVVIVIPIYFLLLTTYLSGLTNSFILLGGLLLMITAAIAILIIFYRRKIILQTALFSILFTAVLFVYEARLLSYEGITYLVESYRQPEELRPKSNLFILSVGLHDIHYIQDEEMLVDTLEANHIQPLNIYKVTNKDKYTYKTSSILQFIGFEKDSFHIMGGNVRDFTGEELPFISDFLERDNLEGDSAGLVLGLYTFIDLGQIENNIPIGVTGTLEKNGDVMEVGGIRAKMMIAAQNNFSHVIIPADNLIEAEQVKKEESLNLNILTVGHIDEAIDIINDLNRR